jgi:hypothetical protein
MSGFEVDREFLFVGRTFEEYRRMFGLDPAALAGQRLLDCPGGPSSFTAVARSLGAETVAVDTAYGPPVDALAGRCRDAVDRTVTQLSEKRDLFVWDEYGDPVNRGRYLRAAAERFLADYERHPSRYLRAGLPRLPFPDDRFDRVLSANLLFLYDDRLDERFHRRALAELCRVSRGELRVFPLASLDRERSALVAPLVADLRAAGVEVSFTPVEYEFQPGVSTVVVCSGLAGVTPAGDERDSQAL